MALFLIVPKGFIPDQDTDQIAVTTEAAQGASFDKLVEYQNAVATIISRNPNVEALVSTVGGAEAQTLGRPEPGSDRRAPEAAQRAASQLAGQIIESLRPQLANVVGMNVYLQNPPTIRIGGEVSKSLYQYSMQSPDRPTLYAAAQALKKALAAEPEPRGRDE